MHILNPKNYVWVLFFFLFLLGTSSFFFEETISRLLRQSVLVGVLWVAHDLDDTGLPGFLAITPNVSTRLHAVDSLKSLMGRW